MFEPEEGEARKVPLDAILAVILLSAGDNLCSSDYRPGRAWGRRGDLRRQYGTHRPDDLWLEIKI